MMKTLLLLLSLYTKPADLKAWSMPYSIKEVKPNAKLARNIAQVKFEFTTPDNCGKDKITIQFNQSKQFKPKLVNNQYVLTYPKGKFVLTMICPGCDTIITDSIQLAAQTTTTLTVNFGIAGDADKNPVYVFKPVIYLYPEKVTDFKLALNCTGQLDFTYPAITKSGWNVTAHPDGTLETNGKTFNYLFWDGTMQANQFNFDHNKGFVVESTHLVSFLEEKLTAAGLNSKEAADFITFWMPMMMKNKKNFVHFLFTPEYEQVSTMQITPKPDNILRLYMIWSPLHDNNQPQVIPQEIPAFKREGNVVIEWGGSMIENVL